MVGPRGFEPLTNDFEDRYSIQLSQGPIMKMVGVQGFEPWTLWSQTRCATRLRYTPNILVESVGIEPTDLLITSLHLSRVLHYRPARFPIWWRWSGSNRLPLACKATALPDELHPRKLCTVGFPLKYVPYI